MASTDSPPPVISRDTKDWTWVLRERCSDCGLDAGSIDVAEVPRMIRENATAWRAVLTGDGVRERPAEGVWSPLEYGCHVRDVYRLFDDRLRLMLDTDDPLFPNWDQDRTAVEQRYDLTNPVVVTGELTGAAEWLAASFEAVPEGAWHRVGRRSDGAVFTVESLARYLVHDPVHHLHDVLSPRLSG
ncbi:MAG: DinB family protein [Kineosporiaceae bacterium]|jgi:hypothetical protein